MVDLRVGYGFSFSKSPLNPRLPTAPEPVCRTLGSCLRRDLRADGFETLTRELGRRLMDSHARRLEKLRRMFKADRVDALLVASEPNVRYLTGFSGEASVLLVSQDRSLLVSDGRFTTQLQQECPGQEVHIRPVGQPLFEAVGEVVDKFGARRVGFEASALSVANFETLKDKAKTVEWLASGGQVEALRAVKDRSEVEAIRAADRPGRAGLRDAPGEPGRGGFGEGRGRRAGGLSPPVRGLGRRVLADRRGRSPGRPPARPADRRDEDRETPTSS